MFKTITKSLFVAASAAFVTALMLTGCQKETARGLVPDNPEAVTQEGKAEIRGAVIVVDEYGNEVTSLRATGTDIGTWTGLGTYPVGSSRTVKYTLNSGAGAPYTIISMVNATPVANGVVGSTKKDATVTFQVSGNSIVTVKVKKLGSVTSKDVAVSTPAVIAPEATSGQSITINYSTTQPDVDYSGKVIAGTENNNAKSNQTPSTVTVSSNQPWLTPTVSADKVSVTIKTTQDLSATSIDDSKNKRTATVTINVTGVDGKKFTKTVTVSQWKGYVPGQPGAGEWTLGNGKVPADATHSYDIKGGTWDFSTTYPDLVNTSVKYALYENGVKTANTRWITKTGAWAYTEPASAWASFVTPHAYKATENADNKNRSDVAYGKLSVNGYVLPSAASTAYTMKFTLNQTTGGGVLIDGNVQ